MYATSSGYFTHSLAESYFGTFNTANTINQSGCTDSQLLENNRVAKILSHSTYFMRLRFQIDIGYGFLSLCLA